MPREGHDVSLLKLAAHFVISIHVPREGHDRRVDGVEVEYVQFQSTCPARGTTEKHGYFSWALEISIHVPREGHDKKPIDIALCWYISIHVPREGHDPTTSATTEPTANFNPRAPRGARQGEPGAAGHTPEFQSTCPARGTTGEIRRGLITDPISIHVPREGHDGLCHVSALYQVISIHVPREGHDRSFTAQ